MGSEDKERGDIGDRKMDSNQGCCSPGSTLANSLLSWMRTKSGALFSKAPSASCETGEDVPDNESPDCESHESPQRRLPVWVTAGPVILVVMFAISLQAPLVTQYIWEQMSADIGYNGTRRQDCNSNDPLQQEAVKLTTLWKLYMNVCGCVFGLLSAMLLGPWSDRVGRRPTLVLPAIGLALQTAVYLLVMYLKLHVGYLIIGRTISGISGDYSMFLAGCFAYVSDFSDRKSLAFRVAILEACRGTVGMLASIVGGYWLKAQGIINPFWFVLAAFLATPLYVYFCFEESMTERKPSRLFTVQHYKSVCRLFAARAENKRRVKIILYVLVFSLVLMVQTGMKELFVVYELGAPLCWGSDLIGYGSAAEHLANITSLVGLRLFQLWLADGWVAVLGILSKSSGLIVMSLASTTTMMFAGYGLRAISMVSIPIIRSELSKLVDEGERGALFSLLASVTGLAGLLGTTVFSYMYPATLQYMKGFPFLCGGLLLLLPAGIIGLIEVFGQKPKSSECERSQSQSDVETESSLENQHTTVTLDVLPVNHTKNEGMPIQNHMYLQKMAQKSFTV